MKKTLLLIGLLMTVAWGNSYAQKFALIDMEYILGKIPAYENGNRQLENTSKQWQSEIDNASKEVEEMYKKYQADLVFLSGEAKTKRENEIMAKENAINELRNKYFGPKGDLFQRRQAFMKPLQDNIYEAVKEIASENGYQAVIDRASANSIIFASPGIDISDHVLSRLGY